MSLHGERMRSQDREHTLETRRRQDFRLGDSCGCGSMQGFRAQSSVEM